MDIKEFMKYRLVGAAAALRVVGDHYLSRNISGWKVQEIGAEERYRISSFIFSVYFLAMVFFIVGFFSIKGMVLTLLTIPYVIVLFLLILVSKVSQLGVVPKEKQGNKSSAYLLTFLFFLRFVSVLVNGSAVN